jgi:gamma-glutamylcyclotransferase (GGCT)/AIG2-like uncharacterized protein YtfP
MLKIDRDGSSSPVAVFESDFRGLKGNMKQGTRNFSAIVSGYHGRGRVVLISPHPEDGEPIARRLLRSCVLWVGNASAAEVSESDSGEATREALRDSWLSGRKRVYSAKQTATDGYQAFTRLMREKTKKLSAAAPAAGAKKQPWKRPSVAPSAAVCDDPQSYIFVYGSLRPDDDSGMQWTKEFQKGFTTVLPATLSGARMYKDEYACVVLGGAQTDRVHGWLLGAMPGKVFHEKLAAADAIEGYDPKDKKGSLYLRVECLVDPKIGAGLKLEKSGPRRAWVYVRPDCQKVERIVSGDWLKRNEKRLVAAPAKITTSVNVNRRQPSSGMSKAPGVLPFASDGYTQMIGSRALPQVECLAGPILLTAPHGLRLYRGGAEHGEKRRVHAREKFSTEIVLRLTQLVSQQLGVPVSFICWNMKAAKPLDPRNRDPNYLLEEQFEDSPWHNALVRWRDRCRAACVPCMHIDIHGKKDRKGAKVWAVDLGIDPLLECTEAPEKTGAQTKWSADDARRLRDLHSTLLGEALAPTQINSKKVEVDPEPYLHGLWGHDCEHTLSHQSVRLGIPAMQYEVPFTLRLEMMKDTTILERVAQAIVCTYQHIVKVEAGHGHTNRPDMLGVGAPDSVRIAELMLRDVAVLDPKDTSIQI